MREARRSMGEVDSPTVIARLRLADGLRGDARRAPSDRGPARIVWTLRDDGKLIPRWATWPRGVCALR